jgi:hypothetical protein
LLQRFAEQRIPQQGQPIDVAATPDCFASLAMTNA